MKERYELQKRIESFEKVTLGKMPEESYEAEAEKERMGGGLQKRIQALEANRAENEMTNKVCLVLLLCLFFRGILVWAAPPLDGTIFIDSNIITSSDSTIYRSLTYSGTGERTMYDRRSGWVDLEPFLI